MLFGFGAVWAYQFRSSDLERWLRPQANRAEEPRDSLASPVDGVLGPELDLGWMRLEGPPPPPPPPPEEVVDLEAPSSDEPAVLPEAEEIVAGDLPLEGEIAEWQDEREAGGAPDAGVGGEGAGDEAGAVVQTDGGGDLGMRPDEALRGGSQVRAEDSAARDRESPPLAYEEVAHKFEAGDSLWKIAEKYLGSGKKVPEILELNRGVLDPSRLDKIPVGTEIRIRRPVRADALKISPAQTDTSVAPRSARSGVAPGRASTQRKIQQSEGPRKIARR